MKRRSLLERVRLLGVSGLAVLQAMGRAVLFLGHALIGRSGTRNGFALLVKQLYGVGVLSLPIIIVAGIFIGMVLALQGYSILVDYGSAQAVGQMVALTLLRQLSLSPALVDEDYPAHSAKIDTLLELLSEVIAEGHRALVFSQFTGFLALVRQRMDDEGIAYSYLDGRTRDRAARIEAFRSGDDPVFLISLKAGGFGLTLTEADYVFILDPWWNPAAEAQAIDRTHRIGQDKPVNVYRLVATDTIEEKVVALAQSKRRLFDDVVGAASDMAAPLSADDIRGLLEP